MNRRDFLKLGGAGLAAVGLLGAAGCGGGGGGGGAGGEASGDLRWSMWSAAPEESEVWRGLAKDVTGANPEIRVKLETATFTDYFSKLTTQLASKSEADIVGMQSLRMPGFAARNAFKPLSEFMDGDSDFKVDDFFPSIRSGLSVGDELYALGYDVGPHVLYYNKDLFKKAGIEEPSPDEPMSWDEFRQKAEQLTDEGAGQYGFVIPPAFDYMVPWLWSGGGDYMNGDQTECTLGSQESLDAMKFVTSMVTEDKISAPVTDLANPNFGPETFYSGKVGMYIDGPWQFINVKSNGDFDFDIAPVPAGPAGSVTWAAGSGFGISNNTDNPEAAWEALKTIVSTASIDKLVEAGRGYPSRQSSAPTFEEQPPPPKNVGVVQKILANEAGESRPFTTTTTWEETTVMLARDFSPVFLGRQSVEETVEKVKPQFDKLLVRHQELLERQG